jgi:hypothetical protein
MCLLHFMPPAAPAAICIPTQPDTQIQTASQLNRHSIQALTDIAHLKRTCQHQSNMSVLELTDLRAVR